MDGWLHTVDAESGQLLHRVPVGWRGPEGQLPADDDWQAFEVVTSVQLLPGSPGLVLAGCMDGRIQLLDPRCGQPAAVALAWGTHRQQEPARRQQRLWQAGEPARLCAARCHDNLVVAGGDAAVVSLHDLRMAGGSDSSNGSISSGASSSGSGGSSHPGCFAELALPAAGGQRVPSVFAMDLLYPRLAAGGDRGQVQVSLCTAQQLLRRGAAARGRWAVLCRYQRC